MKQYLKFIRCMHLDHFTCLLTVQNMLTISYFFGILDMHETWSINDIQFWMCMAKFTNLEAKNIQKFFELMDFDETGEMPYGEFYVWVCLLIAVKDRQEKQFMMCHLRTLTDIIDEDMSGSLTIPEFIQLGTLLNFKMSTLERIYDTWDWELAVDRDKIKYYRIKFLIMTLIDEERGWEARRRVIRWRKYKKRFIKAMREPLKRYLQYKEVPAPHLFWEAFQDTELPTFEPKIRHGCCYYFCRGLWFCMTLSCRIPVYLFWWPWKYLGFLRKAIKAVVRFWGLVFLAIWRAIGRCLTCLFCWKCYSKAVKRKWDLQMNPPEEEPLFDVGSHRYYHRHEGRLKTMPFFEEWHTKESKHYEHLDIWEQPWVSDQLFYENKQNAYWAERLPNLDLLQLQYETPPPTPPRRMRAKEWETILRDKYVSAKFAKNYKPIKVMSPETLKRKKDRAARVKKAIEDRLRRQKTKHHAELHMLRKMPKEEKLLPIELRAGKKPYEPEPPEPRLYTDEELLSARNPHFKQKIRQKRPPR